MPIDLTRILPPLRELDEARAAHDSALAARAAAISRTGARPRDPAVVAANAVVDAARARVETAHRRFDDLRLAELAAVASADRIASAVRPQDVIALFPVSVEAKLTQGRLRVRIWPDAIATATHDPRLMPFEVEAGRRWVAANAAGTESARRDAWAALAETLGPTRAGWVARLFESNATAVPTVDEEAPFVPRAALLPDRFLVVGERDAARIFVAVGAPIPTDLAFGFDTTPSQVAPLTNADGQPIQLPERMRWMTDFQVAKRVGMAVELAVAPSIDRIDRLIVIGVRVAETPARSAESLTALFEAHRFSRGLAFVPPETPTNNTRAGGTGLPTSAQRVDSGFTLERGPRTFGSGVPANGEVTARAFGLSSAALAKVASSGAVARVEDEPNGFERAGTQAMMTALFPVTVGAMLEDLMGIDPARADVVRASFEAHVAPGGPIPALRVGRQPYGILPATATHLFKAEPGERVDAGMIAVMNAARIWWRMLRRPPRYEGTTEDALRTLARSTRLYAETTTQDPSVAGHNHFTSVAGALARSSRNSIRMGWLTPALQAVREGQPVPVARPIVDEALRAELTSLARSTPQVILRAPLPSSLLARVVRQALLLEWGQYARTVLLASVDPPSQSNLRTRAAREGVGLYLTVLQLIMDGSERSIFASRRTGGFFPRPDESAIDDPEQRRVRSLVGALADPLRAGPGAARLRAFRDAVELLARLPNERLEALFFGAIDTCNHRVDAWLTALSSTRLATLRARAPEGVVIGAWGVLEDVRPANPAQRAEHIHTPSLDHAAAAAVLRSAALGARSAGSAHADIDLSSRRVRVARWLLEGLRNGRSLGELLGVRFERALKGTAGEVHLAALRRTFPSEGARTVSDGLTLQFMRPWDGANRPRAADLPQEASPAGAAIGGALGKVEEALDALTDALTAESVYQLVRGNPAAALTDLEAIARGEAPPPRLAVTETPQSGAQLVHRVLVVIPEGARAPGWPHAATPRARAEPLLDAWCGALLGPADRTVLSVDGTRSGGPAVIPVALSALSIAAIDVVLADPEELAERALRAALDLHAGLTVASVRRDRAFDDLVSITTAARRVLAGAEALSAASLELAAIGGSTADPSEAALRVRADAAHAELLSVRTALRTASNAASVRAAAALGMRAPEALAADQPTTEAISALVALADARAEASARAERAQDKLTAIFGGGLPGAAVFPVTNPEVLSTATSPPPELFGAEQAAPAAWLDAVGRAHGGAARLGHLLRSLEIVRGPSGDVLKVAQSPYTQGDRWIGTRFENERTGAEPAGRLSLLIHAPFGVDAAQALGGLVVDAWSEQVPPQTRDTAMALRFNSPNTRAPQAILLAVCPDLSAGWTTDALIGAVEDVLEQAKLRMEPPALISRSGHRALVWLGQRANGEGISFAI